MTYDIATAPDEVPTTGWVVSQICSKHIKLFLNFFFLLSIGRAQGSCQDELEPDSMFSVGSCAQ